MQLLINNQSLTMQLNEKHRISIQFTFSCMESEIDSTECRNNINN